MVRNMQAGSWETAKPNNQAALRIKDTINYRNLGVALWSKKTLQALYNNSGYLAENNEIQAHYWGVNMRKVFDDESIFEIHIPVVFFNYPIEVTSGSVELPEGKDNDMIWKAGKECYELAAEKVIELMDTSLAGMLTNMGFKATMVETNSIHKHPGGLTSFSGTDYSLAINRSGVVFPCLEGDKLSTYASILIMKGEEATLGRTEFRLFTKEDTLLHYEKCRTIAITRVEGNKTSMVEQLFGLGKNTETSVELFTDSIEDKASVLNNPMLKEIEDTWLKSDFEADCSYVKAENVKQENKSLFSNCYYQKNLPTKIEVEALKEEKEKSKKYDEVKETAAFFVNAIQDSGVSDFPHWAHFCNMSIKQKNAFMRLWVNLGLTDIERITTFQDWSDFVDDIWESIDGYTLTDLELVNKRLKEMQ